MSYATIMVHLLAGRSNVAVLDVAATLARRHDARLVGIAATQPVPTTYSGGYDSGSATIVCQDEMIRETDAAEAEFRTCFAAAGHPLDWRSIDTSSALADYIASEARCADLIVTGLAAPAAFDSCRHVDIGDLIMRAGRPVVVVPHAARNVCFDRIVVGWKDGREARRAVADAIPLLKLASEVTIVGVADERDLGTASAHLEDVATWLAQHGIDAATHPVPSAGDDAASLAAVVQDRRADLVVAGAYGHGRLREWAFGGVTRAILLGDRCAALSH